MDWNYYNGASCMLRSMHQVYCQSSTGRKRCGGINKGRSGISLFRRRDTGAAFGIFSGKTIFLGIVSLVVSVVLLYVYFKIVKKPEYKWISWCIIFMCAGALGNCIDRLVNQYVIDFIYFKLIDFPILMWPTVM